MIVRDIKYNNLVLRNLTDADATYQYVEWLNDPIVNQFLSTKKTTLFELRQYIESNNDSPDKLLLGIFDEDKHIGNVKLECDFKIKKAVFGILIGEKEYWNRGIGKKITARMVNYAFQELGMLFVELGVLKKHTNAIKLYKTVGFFVVNEGEDSFIMQIRKS